MEFRSEDGGVTVVFGRGSINACLAAEVTKLAPSASGALVVRDSCHSRMLCESTALPQDTPMA